MLDKLEIARALREIAGLMHVKGDNPFKSRAYENGAEAVEELSEDVGKLVAETRLTSFRGIGPALASQIAELYLTGRSPLLEKLRGELPQGVLEMAQVPGMTLKRMPLLIFWPCLNMIRWVTVSSAWPAPYTLFADTGSIWPKTVATADQFSTSPPIPSEA